LALSDFGKKLQRSIRFGGISISPNGIKLKADRLYKRFGDGGLILGCVIFRFLNF